MRRAVNRPFRIIRARTRSLANTVLHHYELIRGVNRTARLDRAQIFVLGAPRSGTTLLHQLLVDQFEVGWLANDHMRWPGGPSIVERRSHPRAARASSTFESEHGATKHGWEPHEGGEYWYRFFPRDQHELTRVDATPARRRPIRAAVREFADACAAPVVFKNVFNTLRVPVLAAALPEARFILIARDVESNARSLLAGRAKRGSLDTWWSAAPNGAKAIAARTPAEQVVWQVTRMNEVAAEAFQELADDRSLTITYAELCESPGDVLARIQAWLASTGVQLVRRDDAHEPTPFERRAGGRLDDDLERALANVLGHVEDGVR